nr:unnamed protein product [Digitaria exilis]
MTRAVRRGASRVLNGGGAGSPWPVAQGGRRRAPEGTRAAKVAGSARPTDGAEQAGCQGVAEEKAQIQTYGAGPAGEPIRPAVGGNAGYPVDDRSMMAARDIFRPFVGFREVRLVNKEPKHPGGDPIVLCFVDFAEATQAAIALDALQGETDELDIQKLSKLCFVYTKSFVRFTS